MLRARLDVFAEVRDGIKELFDQPGAEPFRERFINGLPTPVCEHKGICSCHAGSSADIKIMQTRAGTVCWHFPRHRFRPVATNLPSSFEARSTIRDSAVSPRAAPEKLLEHSANADAFSAAASECKILARDFWARGLNRWLVRLRHVPVDAILLTRVFFLAGRPFCPRHVRPRVVRLPRIG